LNLLDPDIQKYFIRWDRGLIPGTPDVLLIQKENGEKIGEIQIKRGKFFKKTTVRLFTYPIFIFFKKTKAYLLDNENSVLLTFTYNEGVFRTTCEIVDSENNLIGIVTEKSRFGDYEMKNSKGDKILTLKLVESPSKTRDTLQEEEVDYEFKYPDGNNIAKSSTKVDKVVKESFWKRRYYLSNVLQVNDLNFDRKTLLGMFVFVLFGPPRNPAA